MSLQRVGASDAELRVLLALLAWRGPGPTLDELAEVLGLASRSTVHQHVIALRRYGLVTWEPGKRGTLRALVAPAVS